MKTSMNRYPQSTEFEQIISYCGGNPHGDELPQIGNSDDIALDLFLESHAMTRNSASAYLHHQLGEYDIQ